MRNGDIRKKLIEADSQIITFPPPDYSKMTNEQIRKRTQMIKETFKEAFSENEKDEIDDDL